MTLSVTITTASTASAYRRIMFAMERRVVTRRFVSASDQAAQGIDARPRNSQIAIQHNRRSSWLHVSSIEVKCGDLWFGETSDDRHLAVFVLSLGQVLSRRLYGI